ncbi:MULTISPECIES: hypothetical protein [Streptomyces]|uniref:Uncharacterized protein n=3 Tax=Streptomyces rimosus TaxID=1927 RepID=L8EUC5_STRR1|nr:MULTISPECIES: hypothetical protein [Streptomyces]KOG84162.1 hypothetical protein ADK78_00780 [Kitasatospora aureofaciens]MYT44923.1 hypothetical protein [Streptomyces sp. SID5471]KOT27950.1 hypothetical protein ADK84_37315 [Streptomyces sp. NRRL WC-3701]KOT42248.1 hypothetical protein ADK42_10080 [Streptomyces rimosus subsp. rimosus]KOT68546.1 hypothetical protein ADK44_00745 [Streptomyces rimosus subsp. rimosus]
MIVLSLCGAVLSVAVLIVNFRSWWKGNRELKALIPFGGGLVTGTSWTMCVGGILGWFAQRTAAMGSTAGDWAVSRITGKSGGTLVSGSAGTLTTAGAGVVVVALILGVVVFKAFGKNDKKKALGGLLVGMTLCATAGAAQLMQWVPDLYNMVGQGIVDALNGAVPL